MTNKPKSTRIPPKPTESTDFTSFSTDGPNRQALETTIEQLRDEGRLADVDAARIQIARGLASAVDAQPDNPVIWREYRQAEKSLREESELHADPFDNLIRNIEAEIRDKKKPKAKN